MRYGSVEIEQSGSYQVISQCTNDALEAALLGTEGGDDN